MPKPACERHSSVLTITMIAAAVAAAASGVMSVRQGTFGSFGPVSPPGELAITTVLAAIAIAVGGHRQTRLVPAWRLVAAELLLTATAVWCLYEVMAGDNLIPLPGWFTSSAWWGVLTVWRFAVWRARGGRRHLWASLGLAVATVALSPPVAQMVWPALLGVAGLVLVLCMGVPHYEWPTARPAEPSGTD